MTLEPNPFLPEEDPYEQKEFMNSLIYLYKEEFLLDGDTENPHIGDYKIKLISYLNPSELEVTTPLTYEEAKKAYDEAQAELKAAQDEVAAAARLAGVLSPGQGLNLDTVSLDINHRESEAVEVELILSDGAYAPTDEERKVDESIKFFQQALQEGPAERLIAAQLRSQAAFSDLISFWDESFKDDIKFIEETTSSFEESSLILSIRKKEMISSLFKNDTLSPDSLLDDLIADLGITLDNLYDKHGMFLLKGMPAHRADQMMADIEAHIRRYKGDPFPVDYKERYQRGGNPDYAFYPADLHPEDLGDIPPLQEA